MPNIADFTPEETTAEIWRDIVILTINNPIPYIFSFVRRQTWMEHNTQQPVARCPSIIPLCNETQMMIFFLVIYIILVT